MCSHIHPLERTGSEVSYLAKFLQPVSQEAPCPTCYPSDHWLIPDKVLGDLVYVRWGTRVLRSLKMSSKKRLRKRVFIHESATKSTLFKMEFVPHSVHPAENEAWWVAHYGSLTLPRRSRSRS
ncbi:hypothetical protein Bca52824_066176 [Brassica carinata]|uniref:Uncharacterized protein n=1 Tax=Brassica carinata TaxID=52824 RepID=A0A8X7UBP3_BRACI|nr:hypothetical protein Bca52824_066176 [Brassica carinata]